jgi:hypothetical protein
LTTELAVAWIRRNEKRRFFLFAHYWDVHYDYAPPAPYDSMFDPHYLGKVSGVGFVEDPTIDSMLDDDDLEHVLAVYDGEVRWVDEHVGQLVAVLDELDLAERTVVLVTSDHGDEFLEHGGKGHGLTLYDEIVRIPLVMRGPGLQPGSLVDRRVSLADIMPTVLDLVGVPAPSGMTGTSVVDAAGTSTDSSDRPVYALRCFRRGGGCLAAERSDQSTTIVRFWPFKMERYAANDLFQRGIPWPGSDRSAVDELDDFTAALNRQWAIYRETGDLPGREALDAETQERLEALGYVH